VTQGNSGDTYRDENKRANKRETKGDTPPSPLIQNNIRSEIMDLNSIKEAIVTKVYHQQLTLHTVRFG